MTTEVRNYLNNIKFEFNPEFLIDRVILRDGCWESHVLSYICSFIKEGMVAVDVGANAGYHTLVMAQRVGPSGKVYAFEPNPLTRQRLERNLTLNPELAERTIVSHNGIGALEKIMHVQSDDRSGSLGNAMLVNDQSHANSTAVKVVTLDQHVPEKISFLKIDVEGMELDVLHGARQHIAHERPVIVFETITTAPPEAHKPVEDFLSTFDYRILCTTPDGSNLMQIGYPHFPQDDSVALYAVPQR